MDSEPFHPFNPRTTRWALLLGALACLALTVWAFVNLLQGTEAYAWARAVLSGAMAAAFVFAWVKLRPREEWGIQVGQRVLRIARPFNGEPIELPWRAVQRVSRAGVARDRLVVISEWGPVVIARQLFPNHEAFNQLARDLERHAPTTHFDA